MSNKTFTLSDELHGYLLSVSLREPDVCRRLREWTAGHPWARMQIAPEQAQFMALLVRLIGAKRCLEIGTFTGYSALWVAMQLPSGGKLVACDISEEWTAIGRGYWREAGVDDRIELHLRPAVETLDKLLAGGQEGSFDFAFVDADKENYPAYFERCLRLLRPNGLMAIDNTLWSGRVLDETDDDVDTVAIRDFNRALLRDKRIDLSLIPIADGLTLVRKCMVSAC
ncbi:MAG: class I SAM-dependent methyltransferase [Chromatiales bacterium]|nr:class I SAM-dependent methyltransferase [Chromatiales bacterium]